MRFLVDMPVSNDLAAWLVVSGHDAVNAAGIGLYRAPDSTILERARQDRRIVITADLDYPRILALTQSQGPGLILFRGGNYSEKESVECLRRALESVPTDELPHSIIVIQKDRIRRRRLPLQQDL